MIFLILAFWFLISDVESYSSRVMCYYDSIGTLRDGLPQFGMPNLIEALDICTHLIYGFAEINAVSYELEAGVPDMDINDKHFVAVTDLKYRFPNLTILLSVGGERDDDEPNKYISLLESVNDRGVFVRSAVEFITKYGFHGLDLAWEFPLNEIKKGGGFWKYGWKKKDKNKAERKLEERKHKFTILVQNLKRNFKKHGLILTVSVLPKVISSIYFDVPALIHSVDFFILWAFDYFVPERNPKVADYGHALYKPFNRSIDDNANYLVQYWLINGAPRRKIVLAIPTFGRSWKLINGTKASEIPPIHNVDGPGAAGPHTNHSGLLSYAEICGKMANEEEHVEKVCDRTGRYGYYAFIRAKGYQQPGTWITYENPASARFKADYVKTHKLGGIGLVDITLDDFTGYCTGKKFPILRAATEIKYESNDLAQ